MYVYMYICDITIFIVNNNLLSFITYMSPKLLHMCQHFVFLMFDQTWGVLYYLYLHNIHLLGIINLIILKLGWFEVWRYVYVDLTWSKIELFIVILPMILGNWLLFLVTLPMIPGTSMLFIVTSLILLGHSTLLYS